MRSRLRVLMAAQSGAECESPRSLFLTSCRHCPPYQHLLTGIRRAGWRSAPGAALRVSPGISQQPTVTPSSQGGGGPMSHSVAGGGRRRMCGDPGQSRLGSPASVGLLLPEAGTPPGSVICSRFSAEPQFPLLQDGAASEPARSTPTPAPAPTRPCLPWLCPASRPFAPSGQGGDSSWYLSWPRLVPLALAFLQLSPAFAPLPHTGPLYQALSRARAACWHPQGG